MPTVASSLFDQTRLLEMLAKMAPVATLVKCSNTKCLTSKISRCMQCKKAAYCSTVCQKAHWPIYKPLCMITILNSK